MESFIVAGIILIIIAVAVIYIVREKKKGVKCIGCPMAGKCASQGRCSGGCHSDTHGEG
nr:FeoB-associated Cys-rich membrane protein [Eubacterium sp.]